MKYLSLLCTIHFLLATVALLSCSKQENKEEILVPISLLEPSYTSTKKSEYVGYIKKITIPLTGCFFYSINQNEMCTKIIQHPYLVSIIVYTIAYYALYSASQYNHNKIKGEILTVMKQIFNCLIIAHEMSKKITEFNYIQNKMLTLTDIGTLTATKLFLHNARATWNRVSSYYQKNFHQNLYTYDLNKIDIFDVLQACRQESDMLHLVNKFYDKNNKNYNYNCLLELLENKLNEINNKIVAILPLES